MLYPKKDQLTRGRMKVLNKALENINFRHLNFFEVCRELGTSQSANYALQSLGIKIIARNSKLPTGKGEGHSFQLAIQS